MVVHHSGNRAFVAHASYGVTFRRTVAYDVTQTAYWWDPPVRTEKPRGVDESNNGRDVVYDRALAALVRASPSFRGYRLAGFEVNAGKGLVMTDCVSVGVQGNKSSSGFAWPEGASGEPWRFTGNLTHNGSRDGIFAWQNTPNTHRISDFTAYHNGGSGVEHGAYSNAFHYEDLVLYGNLEAGIRLHARGRDQDGGLVFQCVDIDGAGITQAGTIIDPSPVEGDAAHFRHVAMRGLTGDDFVLSQKAIDGGDTLDVRVTIEAASCHPEALPERGANIVWLPIADGGRGPDPEVARRLRHPTDSSTTRP